MEKKVIKKECTVGFKCWYEDEPNKVWYEYGFTQNGHYFKDADAFYNKENTVCYIPEFDSYWEGLRDDFEGEVDATEGNTITCGYTYSNFLDMCDGVEHLAQMLFDDVDWQCPETLLNEWSDETDVATLLFDVSGDCDFAFIDRIADLYDEKRDGSDWGDLYRFYLKHKNQ